MPPAGGICCGVCPEEMPGDNHKKNLSQKNLHKKIFVAQNTCIILN
jgi:hypothetical protein